MFLFLNLFGFEFAESDALLNLFPLFRQSLFTFDRTFGQFLFDFDLFFFSFPLVLFELLVFSLLKGLFTLLQFFQTLHSLFLNLSFVRDLLFVHFALATSNFLFLFFDLALSLPLLL